MNEFEEKLIKVLESIKSELSEMDASIAELN